MQKNRNDRRYTCELYPTIITPFFEDGRIDYEGLRGLIAHQARWRVDGIFAVCQSSEMFHLTDAEKLELAAFCIDRCRQHGLKCVVSGHTQDLLEEQIAYLKALEALGPDAIILVSNRFAGVQEEDDVWLSRLERVCAALGPETRLGMYECPHPYKRLLSEKMIAALLADKRFAFLKDTCCQPGLLRQRLEQMQGSGLKLYNANSATLLESIKLGAAGYSGVQLNFVPELFAQLRGALESEPAFLEKAQEIAAYISATSTVELQNYPINAKVYLQKLGLLKGIWARNGKPALSESQMLELEAYQAVNQIMYRRFLPHAHATLLFQAGESFPTCHASTILPLGDGTVLVAFFAGEHEKADDVGIWLSVRRSGVWNAPRLIAKVNDTAHWNPVLMHAGSGIRIVFKVGREIPQWQSYTMVSNDAGETWSDPMPYTGQEQEARGPVRSKPIRLSDGSLLAPNSVETNEGEGRWRVCVDRSTDEGASFVKWADIPLNTSAPEKATYVSGAGAIQPTLWESTPGKVHALLRTTAGFIYRSDSEDNGRNWCEAYSTHLPNNNSGIDVEKVGEKLYLVMNPISGNWAARTALVVMRSVDNGAHFEDMLVLEDDPFNDMARKRSEYSYPAIVCDGQALHIGYTFNRDRIAYCCVPV